MTQVTIEIEDGAMPEGWEPERIRIPKTGDTIARYDSQGVTRAYTLPQNDWVIPQIIIRKKHHPGIDCIPKGWWVWQQGDSKKSWVATPSEGGYGDQVSIYGLQNLIGFIPPEDGKPRQIK